MLNAVVWTLLLSYSNWLFCSVTKDFALVKKKVNTGNLEADTSVFQLNEI